MNHNFNIKFRRVLCFLAVSLTVLASNIVAVADDSAASPEKELVSRVITAAGGDEKLLTLFRMEERYNAGKERVSPGTSRVSVVEPPNSWWIGTNERGQEPAKITTWAWTLGVLKDEKSKLALIPGIHGNAKSPRHKEWKQPLAWIVVSFLAIGAGIGCAGYGSMMYFMYINANPPMQRWEVEELVIFFAAGVGATVAGIVLLVVAMLRHRKSSVAKA